MLILCFFSPVSVVNAAEPQFDAELFQQYAEEGREEAKRMVEQFQQKEKPLYRQAYDDYLNDLRVISETGKAPDNEGLYHDLRAMDSDEPFIYFDSEEIYRN